MTGLVFVLFRIMHSLSNLIDSIKMFVQTSASKANWIIAKNEHIF